MNGGVGLTGQSPCAAWMSVWHSPLVSIRTRTSPAPGSGIGRSRTCKGEWKSVTTAALMACSVQIQGAVEGRAGGDIEPESHVAGKGDDQQGKARLRGRTGNCSRYLASTYTGNRKLAIFFYKLSATINVSHWACPTRGATGTGSPKTWLTTIAS